MSYLRNLCLTQGHKDFLLRFLLEAFWFFGLIFGIGCEIRVEVPFFAVDIHLFQHHLF